MTTDLELQVLGLEPGTHACLLYETPDEQAAAVIPFMREGIQRGHRCLYVVDDLTAAEVISILGSCADVLGAVRSGTLFIQTKQETYLRDGVFEPDAMLAFLDRAIALAVAEGYDRLRATGEMTWALGTEPGCDRLLEYETRLTGLIADKPALILCQYNLGRFPPDILRGVLLAHPVAIVGEHVYANPFYRRPEGIPGDLPPAAQLDWMLEELVAHGPLVH